MCSWGDDVRVRVCMPARLSHTGRARWTVKPVDRCLAPLIRALNRLGALTANACCGHGEATGWIELHDGTTITLPKART